MIWTDRFRQVKIVLLVVATFIAVASLGVSHFLVDDLKQEERTRMEVWAEAMKALNQADEHTDLSLVLKVINENNTIPVIVLDAHGEAQLYRNIELEGKTQQDSLQNASIIGNKWKQSGHFIAFDSHASSHGCSQVSSNDTFFVCYDDSVMLKRLAIYPWVQWAIVLLFVAIAIFALMTMKKAEENKVWVGLSKETAHQLGTPISSLMAWTEILKETYPGDELIPELDNDVKRLQLIADRFSKIGSVPTLEPTSIKEVIHHVVTYMDRRTSKSIEVKASLPDHPVIVSLNAALFEWVIENLCKNAVDAMGGERGKITLRVADTASQVFIEVSDTGKGIKKKDLRNIFRPGYTTKQRGWGLGLALSRRIVEIYHKGKIGVKKTEIGKGTTFQIVLDKPK